MNISPRYTEAKIASGRIEDFIDVYEDRMKGWMLDRADSMRGQADGGFAALTIAMSFFEQYWSFVTGQDRDGHSGEFFRNAFKKLFTNHTAGFNSTGLRADFPVKLASFVYKKARNGLFHNGMAKSGVFVGDYPDAMRASVNNTDGTISAVFFNVEITLATIRHELDTYLAKVRTAGEADARAKFLAAWALNHAGEVIHLPPPEPTPPPAATSPA